MVEIDPEKAFKAGRARECLAAVHEGVWHIGKDGVIRWCGRSAEAADWELIKNEKSPAGAVARNGLTAAWWLLFGSEETEPFQARVERLRQVTRCA